SRGQRRCSLRVVSVKTETSVQPVSEKLFVPVEPIPSVPLNPVQSVALKLARAVPCTSAVQFVSVGPLVPVTLMQSVLVGMLATVVQFVFVAPVWSVLLTPLVWVEQFVFVAPDQSALLTQFRWRRFVSVEQFVCGNLVMSVVLLTLLVGVEYFVPE
ncbi:hypothetical protein PF005_g31792, partial [Phytophthora fragariae]